MVKCAFLIIVGLAIGVYSLTLFDGKPAATDRNISVVSESQEVKEEVVIADEKVEVLSVKAEQKNSKSKALVAVSIPAAVSECRKSADLANCLDKFFRDYFGSNTTLSALQEIDKLQRKDANVRIMCHEIVHAVGRETFIKHKTVHESFTACDQTCHSGCYHGAMERFLRGDDSSAPAEERGHLSGQEIEGKIISACPKGEPINLRFQCLHGLGHAVVFYFDYDFKKSLSTCDKLNSQWDKSSCWGGAFMENIHSQTPQKRFLSSSDYHFPCSVIDEKYKADCYVMQTTRMSEMGLSQKAIVEECKNAGPHRLNCLQSVGRDTSNEVRAGKSQFVVDLCEGVGDKDGRISCMKGTAYALLDNTWDGRYAFPFCASLSLEEDRRECFETSVSYLQSMLLVSKEKIAASCREFVSGNKLCLDSI